MINPSKTLRMIVNLRILIELASIVGEVVISRVTSSQKGQCSVKCTFEAQCNSKVDFAQPVAIELPS